MPKATSKTVVTAASVEDFLAAIAEPSRAKDCRELTAMMREATGDQPRMWGAGIVGFGTYHYNYESGREGDSLIVGFAPRKGDLSIYISSGFDDCADLLARLGPHTTGKACLYVKRLEEIDRGVLRGLITRCYAAMRARHP